ncbi:MAG TPA: cation transporter [Gaiellaceae bacterium]|nr:cation transporter [Gaiellaceae bacterium]
MTAVQEAVLDGRTAAADTERVRLALGGMTCAARAARIERKLNKLDGVVAAVNFATEDAAVDFDPARAASTT